MFGRFFLFALLELELLVLWLYQKLLMGLTFKRQETTLINYCSFKNGEEVNILSKAGTPNSGVGDIAEDAFRDGGVQEVEPISEDELREIEDIESGAKPHERIAAANDERHSVCCCKEAPYTDPEIPEEDLITEGDDSNDMRVKAAQRELTDREVNFVVTYYVRHQQVRNIIIDFEDALSENMIKLGKALLKRGFLWAAEEARASLRNIQINLPMSDLDMFHIAFKYIETDQPEKIRAMIERFQGSKNLDGTSVLSDETIDNLETLLNLYNTQLIAVLLPCKINTTPST